MTQIVCKRSQSPNNLHPSSSYTNYIAYKRFYDEWKEVERENKELKPCDVKFGIFSQFLKNLIVSAYTEAERKMGGFVDSPETYLRMRKFELNVEKKIKEAFEVLKLKLCDIELVNFVQIIERLCKRKKSLFSFKKVLDLLFLSSIRLAVKISNDGLVNSSIFKSKLDRGSLQLLKKMERKILRLLRYDLFFCFDLESCSRVAKELGVTTLEKYATIEKVVVDKRRKKRNGKKKGIKRRMGRKRRIRNSEGRKGNSGMVKETEEETEEEEEEEEEEEVSEGNNGMEKINDGEEEAGEERDTAGLVTDNDNEDDDDDDDDVAAGLKSEGESDSDSGSVGCGDSDDGSVIDFDEETEDDGCSEWEDEIESDEASIKTGK